MKKKKKNPSPGMTGASGADPARGQALSIDKALDFAVQHHQAGNLETAENIYRQVLSYQPGNPVALHLMGVIAYQRKRYELATELIGKALSGKPDYADAHSNLGNAFREMGRLDEAEKSYRQAIAVNPGFAMAHYNLGSVLMSRSLPVEAAESFRRAITANPRLAEAHINLGNAFKEQGRLDDAEHSYRKAIAIRPDLAVAHYNLGNIQLEKGRPKEAAACYEQALSRDPAYQQARLNLGAVLRDLGRLEDAAACYEKALKDQPETPDALVNLGAVLRDLGRTSDAESCYRKALVLAPDFALGHFNLGNSLRDQGQLEEAVASYQRAVTLSPDCPAFFSNLGNTLRDLGRTDDAVEVYRKALDADPGNAEARVNLGNAFKEMGQLAEAEAAYRQALLVQPDMAETHFNLGTVFQDQYRIADAIACYRRALSLRPNHVIAHSNLLMNIQYDPEVTPETLLEEALDWERKQLAGVRADLSHSNVPDPERRIRIGYVSGDFRRHPVGYFLDGVLACHHADRFEVFCYANQSHNDDLTDRLRKNAHHWRDIVGSTDGRVADLIRADSVDILVDLSGHTARNILTVFAGKPAPVQATWAGYVGTTGLSAMDYLISDNRETPEGTDRWYREEIVRLPDCYVCYTPPDYAPPVASLPARENGFVTFGCFNNLSKLNPAVLELWSRLLREMADVRLLLVTKGLDDAETRERFREPFARAGVAERVYFRGMLPHPELLARYGEVDIALDPFPYSGGLTTLESLWMGVPVITLGGDRFAARHSLSHLTAAGLTDFITDDADSYLEAASSLAGNLPRLESLRFSLRDTMAASPLCDCPRFTRNLEGAYRTMWRRWCAGRQVI
jgi:predicted O-linked N-acetylglucosamine transferase (SPINDLY family)